MSLGRKYWGQTVTGLKQESGINSKNPSLAETLGIPNQWDLFHNVDTVHLASMLFLKFHFYLFPLAMIAMYRNKNQTKFNGQKLLF